MNHNPISDVIGFLQQPGWTTVIFWILVVASIVIAVYAFSTIRSQRSMTCVCDWIFRFLIGCMWWQQTLWKLPPYYTDHPDQPFGETGLPYWMGVMGKSAAIPLQANRTGSGPVYWFANEGLIARSDAGEARKIWAKPKF